MEEQLVSPTVKRRYETINRFNGEITTQERINQISEIKGKLIEYDLLFAYIYAMIPVGRYFVIYKKDDPYSIDEIIIFLGRKRYTENRHSFAYILCRLEDIYNKKYICRVHDRLMRYQPIEPEDDIDSGSYWYLEDSTSKEAETPTNILNIIKMLKLPKGIELKDFQYIRFIFSFYY